jgi:hypothetical protein
MIRLSIVKWVAAGALALAAVPAIGWAMHSNHVSAAAPDTKLVHPASATVTKKTSATHHASTAKKVTHHAKGKHVRKSSRKHTSKHAKHHTTRHHTAKKSTAKKTHA